MPSQYITATFAATHPNLSINGLSGAEMASALTASASAGEELEPYDTRLASRIQNLSGQIEALTLQLAVARREAPRKAALAYKSRVEAQEDEWGRSRTEAERKALEGVRADTKTGVEGVQRWEGMREGWERGVSGLGCSLDGVGGTAAKLERARQAVEVLEGRKG